MQARVSRWGTAQKIAGNLNVGGIAGIDTVSSGAAGSCVAGGSYWDAGHHFQVFVTQ